MCTLICLQKNGAWQIKAKTSRYVTAGLLPMCRGWDVTNFSIYTANSLPK
jgi:hypothetical protein